MSEAVDLGYGTTLVFGFGDYYPASIWYVDGKPVALSHRQLLALAQALQHGNAEAGYRMGIAEQTVTNLLTRLYSRLGVFNRYEAAIALGWLTIPAALLDASPEDLGTAGGRSVAGPEEGRSAVAPSRNGAAA